MRRRAAWAMLMGIGPVCTPGVHARCGCAGWMCDSTGGDGGGDEGGMREEIMEEMTEEMTEEI